MKQALIVVIIMITVAGSGLAVAGLTGGLIAGRFGAQMAMIAAGVLLAVIIGIGGRKLVNSDWFVR